MTNGLLSEWMIDCHVKMGGKGRFPTWNTLENVGCERVKSFDWMRDIQKGIGFEWAF